ncbi:low temperature requirement protein A [Martelella mediterranea]|uniref:Putative membrane protein n=1 Tax=Martelella mediterranea DSM 17316 TaxID=1122214 RepID=A0A1U9Z3J0_9HYPH|nr:low temperature requirement protein A [Martelella mediterranea]AQZ52234.1 putative membrane protein [Martelella mediterranea DSM 17316]
MSHSRHPMWSKPTHHLDVEKASDHVHWVELFFDLIHVVTIFLLGNFLSHHLDWAGFWIFTGLFVAIFFAWADSTVYNSLFISTDLAHRILMAIQVVTAMFMAAALPAVTGGGWSYFALAYAVNRTMTAVLYLRASSTESAAHVLARRQGTNFLVLGAVFAVSAFLPQPFGWIVFALGLAAIQIQYMAPRFGTLRIAHFIPRLGHLSERFGLIMLILLGEGFFKLVVTLSDKGIYKLGTGALVNLGIGGLSIFMLAWIYFDSVGNARPKSRDIKVLLGWWLGHLVLMWATVMLGVALAGEIYAGFAAPYPLGYGLLGTGGLALFILMIWYLQTLIANREIVRRHAHGGVRIFGIVIALLLMVIIQHLPGLAANTIFAFALWSQIIWPLSRSWRDWKREPSS